MRATVEAFQDYHNLTHTEGRTGLTHLCTLVAALGYKDPQQFGRLSGQASIGDLMNFLEDNSGAIESIITWISKQRSAEWKESLKYELPEVVVAALEQD